MAKTPWLSVDPSSGVGDASIQNTGIQHTGRLKRQTTVTAVLSDVEAASSYQASQEPKPEFLTIQQLTYNVGQELTSIEIEGTTNSARLTFTLGVGNNIPIIIPSLYNIGLSEVEGGKDIPGDPGAEAQFDFNATVLIPKNTIGARVGKLTILGGSIPQTVTINQATSTYNVYYAAGQYISSVNRASQVINYGATANATAVLRANNVQYTYSFDGWYEGSTRVSTSLALNLPNITSSRSLTAVGGRVVNRYTIGFNVVPAESGIVTGAGTYDYGENVYGGTTPATGYVFDKWVSEDSTEYVSNPQPFLINGNRLITAQFSLKNYLISVSSAYRVSEQGDFSAGTIGGSITGGGIFSHGSPVSLSAVPAEGYLFVGWYDQNGNLVSSAGVYNFIVTGMRNLTGMFQRQWFTIIFNSTEGGSVSPTSSRVQYGGSTSSRAIVQSGRVFSGWFLGGALITQDSLLNVANVHSNETYVASFGINIYEVEYQAGEGVDSVFPEYTPVGHGSDADKSTAELSVGYDFDGWYEGSTRVSTDLIYGPVNVTSSKTYVAKATLKTFTLQVVTQYRDGEGVGPFVDGSNGGSATGAGSYQYGFIANIKSIPATGYDFVGFFDSDGNELLGEGGVLPLTSQNNALVYVRFHRRWFTVTYISGTGINPLTKITERIGFNGSVSSEKAIPSVGYSSPTWTISSGTASISVSNGVASLSLIRSDVVITASAPLNSYSVIFQKGSNIWSLSRDGEIVNHGSGSSCVATIPGDTTQYTYSFDGWYEGSTRVSTSLALSISNVTSNRTFQARGLRVLNNYSITVNNGSGGGTYGYGTSVTLIADTIEGYTFTQWEDGVKANTRQVMVLANATYTALYEINKFTITYNKSAGVNTLSRTTEVVNWSASSLGSTATLEDGYSFAGWFDGSVKVSDSLTFAPTNIRVNKVYEARAVIYEFTIQAISQYRDSDEEGSPFVTGDTGGTVSGSGTYLFGQMAKVMAFSKMGFVFAGFYDKDGSELAAGEDGNLPLESPGNAIIYARFQRTWLTVSYSSGIYVSSVSVLSEKVPYGGDAIGSLMDVLETNSQYIYGVDGWYEGGVRVSSSLSVLPTNITTSREFEARGSRTLRKYLVSYAAGQYISSVNRASEEVSYGSNALGSTAVIPADTNQYTYSFDGWYEGSTRVSTSLLWKPSTIQGVRSFEARGLRTLKGYSLNLSVDPSARGTVAGGGTYAYGSAVTAICNVNEEDVFDGWYEGSTRVSTNTSYSFALTSNRVLVAKIIYLDVTPSGLSFSAKDSSKTITINTNTTWTIES